MPRTVAGGQTLTAEAGTTRRRTAGTGDGARTGGVARPSMANVPGREKERTGGTGGKRPVGKGWQDFKKVSAERSTKFPRLDIDKDAVVIRFAEAEPFAFIYRHWVNKIPYTCVGEDCPLCEVGDRAKPVVFYNVITVDDCVLRVWEMSSEPTRKVQKHYDKLAEKELTLDDPGLYFVVSKDRKDNNFFEYEVEKVPARDLEDECQLEPLGDDEIAEATKRGLFTDEIVKVHTKAELREAVEKLDD